jgi:hypothetical protein
LVRRVLRDKFALELFENPYVDEDPIESLDALPPGKCAHCAAKSGSA